MQDKHRLAHERAPQCKTATCSDCPRRVKHERRWFTTLHIVLNWHISFCWIHPGHLRSLLTVTATARNDQSRQLRNWKFIALSPGQNSLWAGQKGSQTGGDTFGDSSREFREYTNKCWNRNRKKWLDNALLCGTTWTHYKLLQVLILDLNVVQSRAFVFDVVLMYQACVCVLNSIGRGMRLVTQSLRGYTTAKKFRNHHNITMEQTKCR